MMCCKLVGSMALGCRVVRSGGGVLGSWWSIINFIGGTRGWRLPLPCAGEATPA